MQMKTLVERLYDWVDFDCAAYELGITLGIFPEAGWNIVGHDKDPWNGLKHIIWSRNNLEECLSNTLDKLVELGILEKRDEPDCQYRANPNFDVNKQ